MNPILWALVHFCPEKSSEHIYNPPTLYKQELRQRTLEKPNEEHNGEAPEWVGHCWKCIICSWGVQKPFGYLLKKMENWFLQLPPTRFTLVIFFGFLLYLFIWKIAFMAFPHLFLDQSEATLLSSGHLCLSCFLHRQECALVHVLEWNATVESSGHGQPIPSHQKSRKEQPARYTPGLEQQCQPTVSQREHRSTVALTLQESTSSASWTPRECWRGAHITNEHRIWAGVKGQGVTWASNCKSSSQSNNSIEMDRHMKTMEGSSQGWVGQLWLDRYW